MITRILERDEYPRLAGTELEAVWPYLPAAAHVVVVEDGDRIVGCWALFPLVHVEGCWIDPEYRKNARVARRLLVGMASTAQAMGAEAVQTAAVDPEVAAILAKLGAVKLPGDHYSLRIASEQRTKENT